MTDIDPDFASVPEFARYYRSLGIQAVPAKEPRESKSWKRPALATWRDLENDLASDETFDSWYGPQGQHINRKNIGLICGHASGGLFVIDLDTHKSPQAQSWWMAILDMRQNVAELETSTQTTGGGGKQLIFKAPSNWLPPTCKTPIGVDIRGEGGFAVLPPSRHESGNSYQWDEGLAPWEIGIADAPHWLCGAIDQLVEQYGGTRSTIPNTSGPIVQTPTPTQSVNNYGFLVDGREDYMTKLVWARVVDERRQTPIKPGAKEIDQIAEALFVVYERNVKSRLPYNGATNEQLLEREGRGKSLMRQKMHAAFAQWEDKVQLHAEAGPPEKPHGYESPQQQRPVEQIKFDPKTGEITSEQSPAELEVLSLPEIRLLPDPKYLIEGLVIENALGFIFGPPGCGKTFIELGQALSIAYNLNDWWGRKINKNGPVIYISSEGSSDMKFRIGAWEYENNVRSDNAPFFLIRQSLNFMSPIDVNKLLKAVARVAQREGINPVLIVVDTVSRVIPGTDENLQKDVTLFIQACDMLREAFGATVTGIHHTSRAGNLRGSTVFDGAGDYLLSVEKDEGAQSGRIIAKKIKSAADGWSQEFQLKSVTAGDIGGHDSLVAIGSKATAGQTKQVNVWPEKDVCRQILYAIDKAWQDGKPWSSKVQSRKIGRYAPMLMSDWQIKAPLAEHMIETWLARDVLSYELRDPRQKLFGLRVIGSID